MAKINVEKFETDLIVRPIKIEDFEQIVELQLLCFPNMKPWTREQVESQLSIFPEGQICIEYENEIIASSSSLIIEFDIYGEDHSWKDISSTGTITNHHQEGDTLYGIEIMVHPEYRGMKLARRLYNARKQLARDKNLMRIVIGGRLPGFAKAGDMPVEDYIEKVVTKALYDPVLTTQIANGFVLKRYIKDYLGSDEDSLGYATLLEWTNFQYQPETAKRFPASKPVRICAVQYRMRKIHSFADFEQQCEYYIDVASAYKSDFVLFPEIITTQLLSFIDEKRPGLAARKLAEFTPQYLKFFSAMAIRYNINIIGGSHFITEKDHLYNVAFLFKRDGGIDKQYKIHITPNERYWWGVEPGSEIKVLDTDMGKISIQICYDVEFPELSRVAVERGARIIFVPFCTDERKGYCRVRYCAQARCVENQIYVAIAGNVGNLPDVENMDIQYAQSAILTPSDFNFARDGIAAECNPNIETVVIHDVDLEILKRSRTRGTTTNWLDRRTDLYSLTLNETKDDS